MAPPVESPPRRKQATALIVCIGPRAGGLLDTVLDGRDLETRLVDDATAASEAIAAVDRRPACVVVPAPATAREVRKSNADVPVVLCSADPDQYAASDVLDAGITAIVDLDDPDAAVRQDLHSAAQAYADEQARRRAESVLDSMFEQFPHHMFVKDADGRHRRVSDAVHDPSELLGKADFEVWPDHCSEGAGTHADDVRVIDSGDPMLNEEEYSEADDSWYLTSKVPWRVDGETVGLVGIAVEITERKEREQLFRNTSRLLRAIVQASPVPIVVHDVTGTVQLWNDAAEQLFGWSAAESIGEPLPPYVPADRHEEFQALVDRVIDEGSVSGVDVQRRTAEGTALDLQVSAATVQPTDSETRIVTILSDVTGLKDRERRLRRQNQRMEAFTTVLAHDLRNPIQVIQGQLEAVSGPDVDQEILDRAMDRINGIVDDVVDLAQESPIVTDPEPVALSEAARAAWTGTDAGSLVVESDTTVRADPPRLRLLLSHLYENTLTHGAKTDSWDVTVRVGEMDRGFFVADDGDGIDEQNRDRVLEPGFSTAPGETGYGLNVVQEIAAAHGWSIALGDNDDGGVTVEIRTRTDRDN